MKQIKDLMDRAEKEGGIPIDDPAFKGALDSLIKGGIFNEDHTPTLEGKILIAELNLMDDYRKKGEFAPMELTMSIFNKLGGFNETN